MSLLRFAVRNLRRSPLRNVLTILAVAVSLSAFLLLRAVSAGWTEQVAQTPNNRVVSRHKIGWSQSLPLHYLDEIRAMPGIRRATGVAWAGFKVAGRERVYVDVTIVEPRSFVDMHYELSAPSEQKEAFVHDRQGALVSEELAQEFGWQLGDTVVLKGGASEMELSVNIRCIYRSTRHGFAQRGLWFHFDYYNQKLPENLRDRISIVSAEIFEPRDGARIAKAIDIHFDVRDDQTFTQEDQALNASFVGMFGAILEALNLVSVLILGVIALILGNTVTMGVRERVHELGVLRALGFGTRHFLLLLVGEAALLGGLGALLGFGLSFPLVEKGMSRFLSEVMDLPPLVIPLDAGFVSLLLGLWLGAAAAAWPALRLGRLSAIDALRRIG